MIIAFTGEARIDEREAHYVDAVLQTLTPAVDTLRTGACIGVDTAVAEYGLQRGFLVHTVVPANRKAVDPLWREHCSTFFEMPPDTDYRDRNTRMVQPAQRLIAFPRWSENDNRSIRSGTWMTVRIARKLGIPVTELLLSCIPAIDVKPLAMFG